MPVPVYLDLIALVGVNILLSFIATGLPGRVRSANQSEGDEYRMFRFLPRGTLSRIIIVVLFSVVLGVIFIFSSVTFLYQFFIDLVLVGLIASLIRLFRVDVSRKTGAVFIVLFMLVGISSAGYYGAYAQVNNAYYFNSLLNLKPGTALFANSTLPLAKLPLVSEDYARSIASSHLSDFGGSVQLVDNEQIVHQNQPYWIFTIAPTNTFAVNHELGFILVDAVNGSYYEAKSTNTVGPGLFFTSEIDFHSFTSDTSIVIGNHYPTPGLQSLSSVLYVFTQSQVGLDGVTSFNGGVVYGADGSVVATYSGLDSPSYVNQPWDKFLVADLANQWGSTRNGNGSFSLFAGGFFSIPASQFRLALSSDEELIPYRNGTAYMLFMSPANAPNSLDGVILAFRNQFTFYNMKGLNLVSPDYAKATVQSKLPALSNGQLFAANPVIYPVQSRFVWIVPYYYASGTGIVQFQGIAVMDASNAGNLVIQQSQGTIDQTRDAAVASLLGGSNGNQTGTLGVNGTITDVVSYVQNGNTYVSIQVNGKYYFATASSLPLSQWILALKLQVGETVQLQVQGQQIVGLKA
jgi:hypothetical protein